MEQPLRVPFRTELAEVDAEFGKLLTDVTQKVAAATDHFLGGASNTPVTLVGDHEFTEPIYREVERRVNVLIARQAPVAGDLRYLLSVLRAVPVLRLSAELASEITRRGPQGLAGLISPRARILITRLGDVVTAMWQEASQAWLGFTPEASTSLESANEEHDDLLAKLVAEIAASDWPAPVTMDMALIARFYERLGDHASEIARDIDQITGSVPMGGDRDRP